MPVSNDGKKSDEAKPNVKIVEISRFYSSLLERSGQAASKDESQGSFHYDPENNICSTSEMLNSWRPFDTADEGDDASSKSDISTVKSGSLEERIMASSARGDYEQLKLLVQEQRKRYKHRVLLEKAKRKAIERLLAEKSSASPSGSEGVSSNFTLAETSQQTDWSDKFLTDLVRKTARKAIPAQEFKNENTQRSTQYCSCSNGSYRSTTGRPGPGEASESSSVPSSSPTDETVPKRGSSLWFLPLHSAAGAPMSLQARFRGSEARPRIVKCDFQECLRARRPQVIKSMEFRRERLRKSRGYRNMLSAKIRQQAEHVALGLISEEEARHAILSLPRPDIYLNADLIRETKRNHRYLPEQLRKKAEYRKQLELATNRILSRMVAQRISYDRLLSAKCPRHH